MEMINSTLALTGHEKHLIHIHLIIALICHSDLRYNHISLPF